MKEVLTLATAGRKPAQLADTEHYSFPRVDYIELKRLLETDVLDYCAYDQTRLGNLFRSLEIQVRSDLYLTLLGLLSQRRHRLVFAMSERAGIPFAGLRRFFPGRRPFVTMFQCWSDRQEKFVRRLNLFSAMDRILVHCQSMKRHFVKLGVQPCKVQVVPYSVDHLFFTPRSSKQVPSKQIMSVGEIRTRDYETLFKAVDGIDVNVVVAASGSWYAREKERTINAETPSNVHVTGGLPPRQLRALYADSQFVVLPVYDSIFSAGATAVLESSCMGKAVIAHRSRGLQDYVIDGETGLFVTPGNIIELRDAIQYLLHHPSEAQRMGDNARQHVEEFLNLDRYVDQLATILKKELQSSAD